MRKIKGIINKILRKYNGMPLMAIALILCLMFISSHFGKKEQSKQEDDITGYTSEDVYTDFLDENDDTLSVYGIKEIKIKEGSDKAELYYINPEQNADKYYIVVSIKLKGSGEVIYSSDLIPPGKGLYSIELSRSFKSGTYDAVFHIQSYKMNDLSSAKAADLEIQIIVTE